MKQNINWQEKSSQAMFVFLILLILSIFMVLIFLVRDLVILFIFSLLINYLFSKPVNYLSKLIKLRAVAVFAVMSFALVLLGFIINHIYPLVSGQISSFNTALPLIQRQITDFASSLNIERFDNIEEFLNTNLEQGGLLKILSSSLTKSVYTITAIVITLIVSFYLLTDGEKLWSEFIKFFPARYEVHINAIKKQIDLNLSALVIGQFKIAAMTSTIMLCTYLVIGNKFAVLLGLLQMLEIVPVFGTWAAIIPVILIVMTTSGTNKAITAFIVYLVYTQIIRDHIIAPRIMGSAFGIHPLAVIFGLLTGIKVFGAIGVIVSLPIIAIVSAVIHYFTSLQEKTPR
jgi:predicted PurR-regulated permease PerM